MFLLLVVSKHRTGANLLLISDRDECRVPNIAGHLCQRTFSFDYQIYPVVLTASSVFNVALLGSTGQSPEDPLSLFMGSTSSLTSVRKWDQPCIHSLLLTPSHRNLAVMWKPSPTSCSTKAEMASLWPEHPLHSTARPSKPKNLGHQENENETSAGTDGKLKGKHISRSPTPLCSQNPVKGRSDFTMGPQKQQSLKNHGCVYG